MTTLGRQVRTYMDARASSPIRYCWNGLVTGLLGWVPGLPGIALRSVAYRLILRECRRPAIERGVRLRRPEDISLGRGTLVEEGVLLDAGPGGLVVGDGSLVMRGCTLQVYDHRGLPQAGIRIGRRAFIGEHALMRGQGGITVGDDVLIGPGVQLLAVEHVMTDPSRPIRDQGITAAGIRLDDGCWLGAGAIVLDGVTIGRGACIGAGAVVTRSVPPYTLAVGVPARIVRRVDEPAAGQATLARVHAGGLTDL